MRDVAVLTGPYDLAHWLTGRPVASQKMVFLQSDKKAPIDTLRVEIGRAITDRARLPACRILRRRFEQPK